MTLPDDASMNDDYPVQFSVEYGDGSRNRLTALFRWVLVLPVLVVYVLLTDPAYSGLTDPAYFGSWANGSVPYSSFLMCVLILLILFRKKYPRWIFDFVLALTRFGARVIAYASLLVDEYPSIDEEQNVRLDIVYPDADAELNRFLPLVKWFLAIPHYIVLIPLGLLAGVATFVAWIAIIITGRYPEGLFRFVVGVSRWSYRVLAYALLLITDRYPPFSLNP